MSHTFIFYSQRRWLSVNQPQRNTSTSSDPFSVLVTDKLVEAFRNFFMTKMNNEYSFYLLPDWDQLIVRYKVVFYYLSETFRLNEIYN